MRYVVTGANGLVGSRLCRQLEAKGHEVVALGRGERRGVGAGTWVTVDLTDGPSVAQILREARPEVILHPAAMTDVDGCERDPHGAWAANAEATAHVALQATALGAHLVAVSTDYVFDGEAGPYDETATPNPRGAYARSKLAAELAVQVLAPQAAIARTAVVYGWPMAAKANFGAWLVGALAQGQQVRLFEDQWVSPSLADNVAAMLIELGERRLGGIWNIAGADVVDRVTFGHALCERFGFDPALITATRMADAKLASPRPSRSGLKTDKAARSLSVKPMTLGEQLASFHQAWRQQDAARAAPSP